MDKPFRTIEEQIAILNSRGVATDESAPEVLVREGYYSMVHGYKDLYLDPEAIAAANEDVFHEGTTFRDIYRLFQFDRALRQTFFKYFAIAEASLKSLCAYHFAEAHQDEPESYLNADNYDEEQCVYASWLIGDFKSALARNPHKRPQPKAYLQHYLKNHDEVPLWVLLRYMTLGQTFKFYCYQTESMRNKIAKGFAVLYELSYGEKINISPRRLTQAHDHIKDFRNICAHEERLYCARVSPGHDISVVDVLSDLQLVLPKDETTRLTNDILDLLTSIEEDMAVADFSRLVVSMGAEHLPGLKEHRDVPRTSLEARTGQSV
ncbi:MAG: Abi family protein [Adlercreutzia mucosicola]|nr:Abi family protein [Adlercreutzia mucosicola]